MDQYNGPRYYNPFPRYAHPGPEGYIVESQTKHKKKRSKNRPVQNPNAIPHYYHDMPSDFYPPYQGEAPPQERFVAPPGPGPVNQQWIVTQPLPKDKSKNRKNKGKSKPKKNTPGVQAYPNANPQGIPAHYGFNQQMNVSRFNPIYEGDFGREEEEERRVFAQRAVEPPSRPKPRGLPRTYFYDEPPGNPTYATTITRSIPDGLEKSEEIPGLVLYKGQRNARENYPQRISKQEPITVHAEAKSTVDPEAVLKDFDAKLAEFDSVVSFPTRNETGGEPSGIKANKLRDPVDTDITRVYKTSHNKPIYILAKPQQKSAVEAVVIQARPEKKVYTYDQEKSYDFQVDEQPVTEATNNVDALQIKGDEDLVDEVQPTRVASVIGGLPDQQVTYKRYIENETPVVLDLELQESASAQKEEQKTSSNENDGKGEMLTAELVPFIYDPPPGDGKSEVQEKKEAYKPLSPPPPAPLIPNPPIVQETFILQEPPKPPTPEPPKTLDAQLVSSISQSQQTQPEHVKTTTQLPPAPDALKNAENTTKPSSDEAYDKFCKDNENCHIIPEKADFYYPGSSDDPALFKAETSANPEPLSTGNPVQLSVPAAPLPAQPTVPSSQGVNNPVQMAATNTSYTGTNKTPVITQRFVDGGQVFSIGREDSPNYFDFRSGKPSNWERLN